MATPASVYSLYIHIPFCRERCTYCAFNTYTDRAHLVEAYVDAVTLEITSLPAGLMVHTVYFGGGTPSLLTPTQLERILQAIYHHFRPIAPLEISLEANPGTVDLPYLQALAGLGINRLSLGAQSAHQSELDMFGRWHHWEDVVQAVSWARQAGFENLSLDLIYGVPGQKLGQWQLSLTQVLRLEPDHLSLYALGLEAGTELTRQVKYGVLPPPDPDLAADMYDMATEVLDKNGFIQYEISNWGKAGKFCQHNLQYWRNLPYLGLGAGAHGYANHTRTINAMRPEAYIQRLLTPQPTPLAFPQTPATIRAEEISMATDQFETIFMGLRLVNEGLSLKVFQQRYGIELDLQYADVLAWLKAHDLVYQNDEYLYLTTRARLISNLVFKKFTQGEAP
jgi:oxygen-independent coproporphyrinogen-3 oxidase